MATTVRSEVSEAFGCRYDIVKYEGKGDSGSMFELSYVPALAAGGFAEDEAGYVGCGVGPEAAFQTVEAANSCLDEILALGDASGDYDEDAFWSIIEKWSGR